MTNQISSTCALISAAVAIVAACGPSQNVNNPDGAGAATPSATASETASADGGGAAGGAAPSASVSAGGSGGGGSGTPASPAALVAAADAANGGKLFEQEHCNGCHGTKAKPPGKFPNLFKVDWADNKKVENAFSIVKKGKSPMPAYGDKLDDKAVADIVAFLKAK